MRFLLSFLVALMCGAGHAQVLSLTDADGNPISININNISIVRPNKAGGSVISYGIPESTPVTQIVQQSPTVIASAACSLLLKLDIVERGVRPVRTTVGALIPVQQILKALPNGSGKAVLSMKYPKGTVYETVLSYSTVAALIDDCVTGGGGGGGVSDGSVTNTKLANMPAATIKGNPTGGPAAPVDLTVGQTKTLLAYTATDVTNSPSGTIVATNTQAAINELDVKKQADIQMQNQAGNVDVPGGISTINFTGAGVTAATPGSGILNVTIPGGGGSSGFLKTSDNDPSPAASDNKRSNGNLSVKTATNEAALNVSATQYQALLLDAPSPISGPADAGNVSGGIQSFYVEDESGAGFNNTKLSFGNNILYGGLRRNTSFPGQGLFIEPNYTDGLFGGQPMSEYYVNQIYTDGTESRPWFFTMANTKANQRSYGYFRADFLDFRDARNVSKIRFSQNSAVNGYLGGLFQDSAAVIFDWNKAGISPLTQKSSAAAGATQNSLITYRANTDGGVPIIRLGLLDTFGTSTMELGNSVRIRRSSGNTDQWTTKFPGTTLQLEFNGYFNYNYVSGSQTVLSLSSPSASPTGGVQHTMNGGNYAINGVNPFMILNRNAPTYAIALNAAGRVAFGDNTAYSFPGNVNSMNPANARTVATYYWRNIAGEAGDYFSDASPEGVITANPGSTCRINASGSGAFYYKSIGTGNTGWILLGAVGTPNLQTVTGNGNTSTNNIIVTGTDAAPAVFRSTNSTGSTGRSWNWRSRDLGYFDLFRDNSVNPVARYRSNDYLTNGAVQAGETRNPTSLEAPILSGVDSLSFAVIGGIENRFFGSTSDAIWKIRVRNGGGTTGNAKLVLGTPLADFGHVLVDGSVANVLKIGAGGVPAANDAIFTADGMGIGGIPAANNNLDVYGRTRLRGINIEDVLILSGTGTVTASSGISDNLIQPGSTQATLTVNLPPTPVNNQICNLDFDNVITTLTVSGNGNTINGTLPTTAGLGTRLQFKFYVNHWNYVH